MDPALALFCVGASLLGCALGVFSGMVPGIHVNTLAAMLLAAYPSLEAALPLEPEGAAVAVCCIVVSASVVHSFVDYVPSVFIGAPDAEDAVSVLPGHRLLLEGRGMAGVRAAAIGSLIGCSAAILAAVPLQWILLHGAADLLDDATLVVLLIACAVLLAGELRRGSGVWGPFAFLASGALGLGCMTLPIPVDGLLGEGSVMMPLLTGLFGIPVMLEASGRARLPVQTDAVEDPVGPVPGLKGVLMGTLAGWFPGMTSTVGASMSAVVFQENRPEGFISTVASIGTVTAVLSLVTLSVSGGGRTGTAIVVGEILGDMADGFMSAPFLMLLLAAAVASVAGYWLTILCGKAMCRVVGRVRPKGLGRAVMAALVALTLALDGPAGLVVLACATAVGMVPGACGTGRVVLSGCLILPVLLFRTGLARSPRSRLRHELGALHDEALVGPGADLPGPVPHDHREDQPPAVDLHELRLAGHLGADRRRGGMGHVQVRADRGEPLVEERLHADAGRRLYERDHCRGGEDRERPADQRGRRVVLRHPDCPGALDSCAQHGGAQAGSGYRCCQPTTPGRRSGPIGALGQCSHLLTRTRLQGYGIGG